MKKSPFYTISVPKAQEALANLHAQVVRGNGRIELTSDDVEGTSVLISKEELQSLEKALAILSDGEGIQQVQAFLNLLGQTTATANSAAA
jgi:hypothetical protein